ncbi:BON domain-containing protein [Permianibacter aggregans]|uniref:Osmotically-inducible protein Y n=1 Tax=Permianibacter aggregans TaxID=1510150 RepID=A0A4R6U9X4_9GAMM|nr:BON domain-containing protein [Permianibacter aggregans]QGX40709.1 BON domain-containing protein [Permianibacter aggregans]TDQ43408.1 osmotically-inducible protein OsmY [Permianibacter aggregans]
MNMQRMTIVTAVAAALALMPPAMAGKKSMEQELSEARIEGQIVATYALNRHLNPFEFDVEVDGNTVMLSGEVEESIDKDLAEQVALGVEGVKSVKNNIKVNEDYKPKTKKASKERDFGDAISDATTTASVKSMLLWNGNTDGMDINVDTMNGVVTLSGTVNNSAEKELAERLAENTDGVRDVENKLKVKAANATMGDKVAETADEAGEAVSDAWITTKVKSSLMYTRNVDGTDINVDTKNGVVTLAGTVESSAERDLAEEIAEGIRGVKDVKTEQLKIDRRETASR